MKYTDKTVEEIKKNLPNLKFLIVTATDIETKALHNQIKPLGAENIFRVFAGNNTYYIGKFGECVIAHVQCSMGSIASSASALTVSSAIDLWNFTAVLMIGIAFGIDKKKQNIGDILISESIIPYNIQKVAKDQIIPRSVIPPAGNVLTNRFKNGYKDWDYDLENNKAKVFFGPMLSGESLIDNQEYRNLLKDTYPTAIGGEMEGAGLYAASNNRKVEWLVVKSVCDYADGNKGKNKDKYQSIAADSAVSFCLHTCSIENIFSELGIYNVPMTTAAEASEQLSDVLFDVYTPDKEEFYFKRGADDKFLGYLQSYSIWVTGDSGCGKTTLILRNLNESKREFTLINLAHCIDLNVHDIFYEIYSKLKDILDPDSSLKTFDKTHLIIEAISELIGNRSVQKAFSVFIEEAPLPDNTDALRSFMTLLNGLLIHHRTKYPKSDFRILLSSIDSPTRHMIKSQMKVYEQLKFLSETFWGNEATKEFLNLLTESLGLKFSSQQYDKIIIASKGSPRFLKKFIRDYILSKCNNEIGFNELIQSVTQELAL